MSQLSTSVAQVTYAERLNQAWLDAQAPRAPDAPTVISTFAGGGGSSTGYHMAGFRELLAVEWEDNAVQTLRANYPHLDVLQADISKLTVQEVLRRTGLEPGELDVLDGSPPCQGFSTAGKRALDDERNQLFRSFVRQIAGLRPKVFVMENVSGMVKGKMKLLFAEILRELKAPGYDVSARLLNAKHYGVPQSRERMIFIGVRRDLGVRPSHPTGSTGVVSVGAALDGCVSQTLPPLKWQAIFATVPPGGSVAKHAPKELIRQYFPRMLTNTRFRFDSYAKRTDARMPAQTIEKTYKDVCPIHPTANRHYSIEEVKRIGAFPDRYVLLGDFAAQWARVGNSVPPLLMRAIALHIRAEILPRIAALQVERKG